VTVPGRVRNSWPNEPMITYATGCPPCGPQFFLMRRTINGADRRRHSQGNGPVTFSGRRSAKSSRWAFSERFAKSCASPIVAQRPLHDQLVKRPDDDGGLLSATKKGKNLVQSDGSMRPAASEEQSRGLRTIFFSRSAQIYMERLPLPAFLSVSIICASKGSAPEVQ
jgi:hypothetical protein